MTTDMPDLSHPALAGNRAYRLQRQMRAQPRSPTPPPPHEPTPPSRPDLLPEALARQFQVEAVLGGEDTRIYRAGDPQLGRTVAIRVPRFPEEAHRLRRFEAEARLLLELEGKGAPAVYEYLPVGRVDPQLPFLITEWFDQTLEEVMVRETLPLGTAVALLERLLEATHAVHLSGVIHRDLKPTNVLLSMDLQRLKLGDFGIGIRVGESPPSARLSHQYTPPEAYTTQVDPDHRVDIYAIGWMAYELLLGRARFREEFRDIYNAERELERANRWIGFHTQSSGARPLHEVAPEIPRELSDIVARMTERDRERRYDTCEAVLRALAATNLSGRHDNAVADDTIDEIAPEPGWDFRTWLRSGPGLATAAAVVALLLGAVLLVLNLLTPSHFQDARAAALGARAEAEAVGAHETPEASFTRGTSLFQEADRLHADGEGEAALTRMEAARDAFQMAREAMVERIASQTREEMQRKRQAATRLARLGADDGPAVYNEGLRLAGLGETDYQAGDYDAAIPHLDGAIQHFDLAIEELLRTTIEPWRSRVDNARQQAQQDRQLAMDNQAEARAPFQQGDSILEEGLGLMENFDFEEAEQAFLEASELYLQAATREAREHTREAREQLEISGFSTATPRYAEGLERAAQAEERFRQPALRAALPLFNDATRLFRQVLAESDRATIRFRMGSNAEERDAALALCQEHRAAEAPPCDPNWFATESTREVALAPFAMDIREVSYREFAAFAEATGYRSDAEREGSAVYWDGERPLRLAGYSWRQPGGPGTFYRDRANHPVNFMTRRDAEAYCSWRGARLPTEAEWELAARGGARRLFPWGNEWHADRRAGVPGQNTRPPGENSSGVTHTALHGMAGNVWEWTTSTVGGDGILKGGSYLERNPVHLRAAARLREDPRVAQADYGFRCVEDSARWTLRY